MIWKVTSEAVLVSPFWISADSVFYKLFELDRLNTSNESARGLELIPQTNRRAEESTSRQYRSMQYFSADNWRKI